MFHSMHCSVSFFFPGYVRLKIDLLKKDVVFGKTLENNLMTVGGINKIEVNTFTGSLLVKYNPRTLDVEELIRVGRELKLIPEDQSLDVQSVKKVLTRGFP